MRFATVRSSGEEILTTLLGDRLIPVSELNHHFKEDWPEKQAEFFTSGILKEFTSWIAKIDIRSTPEILQRGFPMEQVKYAPLYRNPGKIWGIGLNYQAHADELDETTPQGIPGSFMRPATNIIGPDDWIQIPLQSDKTTAEAELGVIIGKKCKNVEPEDWLEVVAGFTTIIDVTAEDILRKNVRYLTLSKSFDTFFSFGPYLVTPDEIENVMNLTVSTVIDRKVHASNRVSNMTFTPDFLVSFHSKVMTLRPGDIISTGTPGAVKIEEGDVVECWIDGFEPLKNHVRDLKSDSSEPPAL